SSACISFFIMLTPTPTSSLFPYTTLFRSDVIYVIIGEGDDRARLRDVARRAGITDRVRFLGAVSPQYLAEAYRMADLFVMPSTGDRKSTRLNSSHVAISYAVFCFTKKNCE